LGFDIFIKVNYQIWVITDMAGNDAAAITKDSNQWAFEIKALSTSISLAGLLD
jgi:hypothetical protein